MRGRVHLFHHLTLLLSVACMGTSILFIRKSELPPLDLSFYRLLVAGLALLPFWWAGWKKEPAHRDGVGSIWRTALVPGIFLALHFAFWVVGARMTPAANASLVVNMTALVLPFLLIPLASERVTPREILATCVGGLGLFWLARHDFDLNPTHFRGDLICLGAMVLLAIYYAFGRGRSQAFQSPWTYIVPVFFVAAGGLLLAILVQGRLPILPGVREMGWILGLVLLPTICGHGLTLYSLGKLRGQVVGMFHLCQFLFAGLYGWIFFHEIPPSALWIASALAVAGAALAITTPKNPTCPK